MLRQPPKIIAFCGKMGSGKTASTTYLQNKLKGERAVKVIKFAGPLYDITQFMCDRMRISPDKNTLRPFMQYTGLFLRDSVSAGVFVDAWEKEYRKVSEQENSADTLVMCDDLRFTNEAAMLRLLGATIVQVVTDKDLRQTRGVDTTHEGHSSEAGVAQEFISCDVFNNASIEALHARLDKLYAALKTNKKV